MIKYFLVSLIVFGGCRESEVVGGDSGQGEPPPASDFVEFSLTGLSKSFWSYSTMSAAYDPDMNITTIETHDDSTISGKFIMSFNGSTAGAYRYNVTGSPDDTNQVDIWFTPEYFGAPNGVFGLTGLPEDSLEATVSVDYYGEVGDSISGTMTASLMLEGSSPPFKAVLYSGRFRIERDQ